MTIFELIENGDAAGIRELLAREPDAAAAHDERGLSALMRAAYRGGEVFDAVRDAGPPLEPFDRIVAGESDGLPAPDAWSPDGFTPLHIAAFARNASAARALLEAGADPDAIARASFAQVTPLGTCAFAGSNDVARVLLEFGANPTLATDERALPAEVARLNGNEELAGLLRRPTS
jgi:ankyrin repeat protein